MLNDLTSDLTNVISRSNDIISIQIREIATASKANHVIEQLNSLGQLSPKLKKYTDQLVVNIKDLRDNYDIKQNEQGQWIAVKKTQTSIKPIYLVAGIAILWFLIRRR